MKNIICILICIISLTKTYAQNTSEVSQFKTVVLNSGTVAYYSMLSDNSVWYATSGEPWSKSATIGLPDLDIVDFHVAVLKSGTVAYYAMLSDNSVWYATSGETWSKSATTGLPK